MINKRLDELTLSDLLNLHGKDLTDLYRDAKVPRIADLDGPYKGVLIEGEVSGTGRTFPLKEINQPWFPWKGKLFFGAGTSEGHGNNRMEVGNFKRQVWNFRTRIGPSNFAPGDTCHIDYDIPKNPAWMGKTIFDELRQLGKNLYFGKGGLRLLGKDRFTFWWAIEKQLV